MKTISHGSDLPSSKVNNPPDMNQNDIVFHSVGDESSSSQGAKTVDLGFSESEVTVKPNHIIVLNDDGSFPYGPAFPRGTTALAFIFDKGIAVAVDHSISSDSSTSAPNVVELNSHMLATITGGSEGLLKELQEKCLVHEARNGTRPEISDVLKWLDQILISHGEEVLPVGILIAAWDGQRPRLYCIDGDREVSTDTILATGSGSGMAYGILDTEHPNDISQTEEAAKFAEEVLCYAAFRAPKSGDFVSVYHVGSTGWERLFTENVVEWQNKNIRGPRWKYEVIGHGW